MSGKEKIGLVLLLITICSLALMAPEVKGEEEEKGEKLVLTLQQLIDMAIEKSPEIGERRSEIVAARSELEQAKGAYYPQVEGIGLIGPVKDATRPVVIGTRIHDPSPEGIGVFGKFDFTVSQPLYTFGKVSNRKEAAHCAVRAKGYKLLEKKYEIVLRVKQLYYALILARAGMDAADDATAFFDDARHRMTRLLELGSSNVIESDLYKVDAYRADTTRSRAEAEKGMKVAYFALKSLINLPPGTEFDVREKTLTVEETQGDLKTYIQRALEERPEFKQLDEALAAQESLVRAVRADLYPSFFVALGGSLAGAPNRETLNNPYITDEYNHANVGVVAGIKWNFDFSLSPKIDKEQAEYQKLLHTKATGRLNIPIQVAKSYQEVHEWKVALEAYNQAAVASRKWVVSALANFDMGVGTADDMLRAIEKYGENQGKSLEALFNYNLSLAELKYAAGVKDW
jgi:outer membrane protein